MNSVFSLCPRQTEVNAWIMTMAMESDRIMTAAWIRKECTDYKPASRTIVVSHFQVVINVKTSGGTRRSTYFGDLARLVTPQRTTSTQN